MEPWVAWLIAAVVLAVGEILTLGFFLAPFAGGALVTAIVAGAGASPAVQIAVFLVLSGVLLAALRPLARKHRSQPPELRTGAAALVGKRASVLERVTADSGSVKLEGETWSARAATRGTVIEPGREVHVVEIQGATALVSE